MTENEKKNIISCGEDRKFAHNMNEVTTLPTTLRIKNIMLKNNNNNNNGDKQVILRYGNELLRITLLLALLNLEFFLLQTNC
jgi:hypothetical protein